jgi:hypothetical protein
MSQPANPATPPAGPIQARPALLLAAAAAAALALGAVVGFALFSPRERAADVVGLWSGSPPGLQAYLGPGGANVVRLNIERVESGKLVGSMRVGALSGRLTGSIHGPHLHAELASGPSGAGSATSAIDGTAVGPRIEGNLSIRTSAAQANSTPAAAIGVVLTRAGLAAAPPPRPSGAAWVAPHAVGLRVFDAIVRGGKFTPGFSAAGDFYRTQNYVYAHKGGRVTYAFSVPAGRTLQVGYGIPRGHVVNDAPLDVLLNGARLATVAGAGGTFHQLAPRDAIAWWHRFGPGSYRLALTSEVASLNVYGLWFDRQPRHAVTRRVRRPARAISSR